MQQLINRIGGMALDVVYPPACLQCGQELINNIRTGVDRRRDFCSACLDAMPIYSAPFCAKCGCGTPREFPGACGSCRKARFRFDKVIALGSYDAALRALILRMKLEVGEATALAMGHLMWARCGERLVTVEPDVVAAVPMFWSRRLIRGTNSALILAEVLAGYLGIPLAAGLLRRRRKTLPQSSLPPSERERNLRNAIVVGAGYSLKDTNVLLVDDILTTGATANAATRALQGAGAGRVTVAVAARSSID